jgi:hypothetical protein
LPDPCRERLRAALARNIFRNLGILADVERVVRAFNGVGIEPVLLKGAAHLLNELYPAIGLRAIGDIDLLVALPEVEPAAAALRAAGFADQSPRRWVEHAHHHLPPLARPQSGIRVEIHYGLTPSFAAEVVSVPWFVEMARPAAFRDLRLRVPEPTRAVAHNIAHAQINHDLYAEGYVELRQLLDLALLRARHETEIDWPEIERRFIGRGLGHVLANHLAIAESLFGQTMPALRVRPDARALDEFRRLVERPARRRWRRLRHIGVNYWRLLCRNPAGVLNLLAPHFWPARLRVLIDACRRPPG